MSSILNSISAGDLQVHKAPEVKPVKEDSIIDLLQSSEIEFATCPKIEDKLSDFNTGFGENNDLFYDTKCVKKNLKTPLYQENYLKEFVTEEEKAAARHALGLYNKGDIVAMSLLTAEDKVASKAEWSERTTKQLRKGDKFFTPITSFDAVFDSQGNSLETQLGEAQKLLIQHQKEIININSVSKSDTIYSLGDVRVFLGGFKNGDNLHSTIENLSQEMLRFEKTGKI